MSDISFTFTWWQLALAMLAYAFWPLTVLAVLATLLWWRRRASWAARIAAGAAAVLWAGSALTSLLMLAARIRSQTAFNSDLRSRQTTLSHPTTVAGMRLPAATVVTRDPIGVVEAVDLPTATEIDGVPIIGHASLYGDGLNGEVKLARDVRVGEVACSASEPATFESGRLTGCALSTPSSIRGIPCTGRVELQAGVVCVLSKDYKRFGYLWRTQTKVTDFGELVWFHVGAQPPSLTVFRSPLRLGADVAFQHGTLASIDLRDDPAHFRGCAVDLILVENRRVLGRTAGACSLPQAPNSMYVALPALAFSAPSDS